MGGELAGQRPADHQGTTGRDQLKQKKGLGGPRETAVTFQTEQTELSAMGNVEEWCENKPGLGCVGAGAKQVEGH